MFETKKSTSIAIPTDPLTVLGMSEVLLRSEAPMHALGAIYDAKALFADSQLRQRGIEGNHFVNAHEAVLGLPVVQSVFVDGLNSEVFEDVATGKYLLTYPGDVFNPADSEKEKNKHFFVSKKFVEVAAEVSGDDPDFEAFVVSMLSYMEAKGRFYDILRDSMGEDITGNLFDVVAVRGAIRSGKDPKKCAEEVWQNIYFGTQLPGNPNSPSSLLRGLIGASAGMIKYRQRLNQYYAKRGVDDQDSENVHNHVAALMYLRRGQVKPGKVTEVLTKSLEAVYGMDVQNMSKLIDDLIVENPHLVTDMAANLRGLTGLDLEELRLLHDAKPDKNTALGRFAIMDEAQRSALALLESAQESDEIPKEVADIIGTKLLNIITSKGDIKQATYVMSQNEQGRIIFHWLYPELTNGRLTGVASRYGAPAPSGFIAGILNETIEVSRDLDPDEIDIVLSYKTPRSAVVDTRVRL